VVPRWSCDSIDNRVLRRIQVQADDVGGFGFKLQVIAGQVAVQPMRFQLRLSPHPLHRRFADLSLLIEKKGWFATAHSSAYGLFNSRRALFSSSEALLPRCRSLDQERLRRHSGEGGT